MKPLKPFNLELAKAGYPVCTESGQKARIVCFDAKGDYPIVALMDREDKEVVFLYTKEGHYLKDTAYHHENLFMMPVKKEGWINLYNDPNCVSGIYSTKEEAIENSRTIDEYVTTIKISWEE